MIILWFASNLKMSFLVHAFSFRNPRAFTFFIPSNRSILLVHLADERTDLEVFLGKVSLLSEKVAQGKDGDQVSCWIGIIGEDLFVVEIDLYRLQRFPKFVRKLCWSCSFQITYWHRFVYRLVGQLTHQHVSAIPGWHQFLETPNC